MITKVPSVYPIWLEAIPKEGMPGRFQNLANVESLTFDSKTQRFILRSISGMNLPIPNKWAYQIAEEFRKLSRDRRSRSPTKTN